MDTLIGFGFGLLVGVLLGVCSAAMIAARVYGSDPAAKG